MRRLKFALAAALILCAAYIIAASMERVNDTPINPDGSINIPSDGSRYIPVAGDVIRCDDGANYAILNTDLYMDCGPLPSIPQEWPEGHLPKGEAVHYMDFSGDYLFVRNLYETRRMVNTICNQGERAGLLHIRLDVPEDISSEALSQWDPERLIALADAGRSGAICLEAWDMFKNGVYYKTLYEIGIDRGDQDDFQPSGH